MLAERTSCVANQGPSYFTEERMRDRRRNVEGLTYFLVGSREGDRCRHDRGRWDQQKP